MTKVVRLADVAREAGVSQGTASNVFNRPDVVSAEVRARVEAAARTLGYSGPDPKARMLRAGKVNAIGVVTAEPLSYFFNDPFARVLLSGVSEACEAAGAGMSLVSALGEQKLAWNIQNAVVDGFILCCIYSGPKMVELSRERGLPFVALDLGTDDPTMSAIGVDDFGGARQAAAHLAALGHRRLAVLGLPFVDDRVGLVTMADVEAAHYPEARDRVRGYFAALAEAGVPTDGIPIFETEGDEVSIAAALGHFFSLAPPPTAILAMSDRVAMTAIEWLGRRGLKVPDDVSIVGFDGVPEAATSVPPLTTVAQPIAAIGRLAVEMILDPSPAARRELLPVELIVRGSTAPPRGG